MYLFLAVTYVSLYVALAFCALCLATGLYYLAELAEEYSVMAKKINTYMLTVRTPSKSNDERVLL